MKKNEIDEEYSISTLLYNLADDDLERKMIELFSKNPKTEEMLQELLLFIRRKSDDRV